MACEITYNNFEISRVVYHAITYTIFFIINLNSFLRNGMGLVVIADVLANEITEMFVFINF